MKHFFDNVRGNNKTVESLEDEKEALRTDIAYLRRQCGDPDAIEEKAGVGIFATEKARLFNLLHSI